MDGIRLVSRIHELGEREEASLSTPALQELSDDAKLEEELIQVAAVAVAWVEAIRRRRAAA